MTPTEHAKPLLDQLAETRRADAGFMALASRVWSEPGTKPLREIADYFAEKCESHRMAAQASVPESDYARYHREQAAKFYRWHRAALEAQE